MTLYLFTHCQVDARQKIGFLFPYFDVHVIVYVIMCFYLLALILTIKRRFCISSHAVNVRLENLERFHQNIIMTTQTIFVSSVAYLYSFGI